MQSTAEASYVPPLMALILGARAPERPEAELTGDVQLRTDTGYVPWDFESMGPPPRLPTTHTLWVHLPPGVGWTAGADTLEERLLTGPSPSRIEAGHGWLHVVQAGTKLSGTVRTVQHTETWPNGILARIDLDSPLENGPLELGLVFGATRPECGPRELLGTDVYQATRSIREPCWQEAVTRAIYAVEVVSPNNPPRTLRWRPSNLSIRERDSDAYSGDWDYSISWSNRSNEALLFFEWGWVDRSGFETRWALSPYAVGGSSSIAGDVTVAVDGAISHVVIRGVTGSGERTAAWVYNTRTRRFRPWTEDSGIPEPETALGALLEAP